MARNRETKWTEERLADLLAFYPDATSLQLTNRYKLPIDEIEQAYQFAVADKNLRIDRRTIRKSENQRAHTLTTYAPAFAHGVNDLEDDDNPTTYEE